MILPNEQLCWFKWQKKLEEEQIELVLWDPVTIKGLEYSTVLAISPWSIERTKLASSKGKQGGNYAEIHADWDSYIDWVSAKTKGFTEINKTLDEFRRFGFQRRRHANVMISRPKHTLFIMHLELPELISAEAPKSSQYERLGHIDELKNRISRVKRNEQYDGSLEGILSDIIESNREWGIISRQSAQILKQKYTGDEPVQEFIQFKILQDFCKLPEESYYDGMRYLEILLFHKSFRALLEPGKSREEVYQRYLRPYQDRFAQIASSFEFKDNKETGAGRRVTARYSPELVPQLITAYNELVAALTTGLITSYSKYKGPIDRFITSNVFAGSLSSESSSLWLENAKDLDLKEGKLSTQIEDGWPLGPNAQLVKIISFFHESSYINYEDKDGKKKTSMRNDILHIRGHDANPKKFDTRYHCPYDVKFARSSSENDDLNQEFWVRGTRFMQSGAFTPKELEELWDKIAVQPEWNIGSEVQLELFWELIFTSNANKVRSDGDDFQHRNERNKRIQDLLRSMQLVMANVPDHLMPVIVEKQSLNLVFALDGNATIHGNAILPQDIFEYVSTHEGYKSVDVRGLFHSELFGMDDLLGTAKLNLEVSNAKVARIYEISGFINKIDRHPENISHHQKLMVGRVCNQLIQHLHSDYEVMATIQSRQNEIPTLLDRDQMRLGASLSFKPFTSYDRIHKAYYFTSSMNDALVMPENRNARLMLAFHQFGKSLYSSQYTLNDFLDTEITEGSTLLETLNEIESTPIEWENFFRSLPDSDGMLEEIDPLLWVIDITKTPATNRFSGWIERQVLKSRDSGLQIPDEPLEKILLSTIGLKQYSGNIYDRATKAEQNAFADRWSFNNWTADFDGDFNPVYIEKVRKHIAKNISNVGWLQRHFSALKDAPQHIAKHWYAFGSGATNSVISIDLARYFSILKFSLFVRCHLADHYSWTTKKQLELIDTIFTPQFIVENVAEIWIDISENETIGKARGRRFSTVFDELWENFQAEFSEHGLDLPKYNSMFSGEPSIQHTFRQLLGQISTRSIADGEGLIGALEMFLHRWTGSNSRLEILPMISHDNRRSGGKQSLARDYQQSKLRFLNSAVWMTPDLTNQEIRDLNLDWS